MGDVRRRKPAADLMLRQIEAPVEIDRGKIAHANIRGLAFVF